MIFHDLSVEYLFEPSYPSRRAPSTESKSSRSCFQLMIQPALTPRVQRLALVNVCLGQFMSALDSRSVNVALPTLSLYFDVSLAVVQWIPLAYQLTIVGLVLSMARLGDKLGRKRIYTLGFVLLGVGSAACGLSPQLWQIICFRIVEAVAAPWCWPMGAPLRRRSTRMKVAAGRSV
jgi:MFS family permease